MTHHLNPIKAYDRPSDCWLVISPVLWAIWIASIGTPKVTMLMLFLVGVVSAFALGRLLLAFMDHEVRQAKTKHIEMMALYLVITVICLLLLDWTTICLSVLGLLFGFFTLLTHKRRLLHDLLKMLTINWPVVLAFGAIEHQIPVIAWIIYAAACSLTLLQLLSKRQVHKDPSPLMLYAFFQVIRFVLLIFMGAFSGQNLWYFVGLLIILLMFIYQLIRWHDATKRVYQVHAWVDVLLMLGILLSYHY